MTNNDTIISLMTDTETFRQKVIDAGIRGKLTKQLPEDGNAEDLYQQIQAEKTKLVKEGKIKKSKPLPEIKPEEIPFEIPKNWKCVRWGNLISLQSGQDLRKEEYNDNKEGIPYITGASNYENDGKLKINRWTVSPKSVAEDGDILLSCKGTVGKLTILHLKKVHIARQIMGIRTYSIDKKYGLYFLQSQIDKIKNQQKGLIPGIERKDVLSLICPLPPIDEQKRIADRIDEILDTQRHLAESLVEYSSNAEVLKSKVIDAGIRGKLTEQLPEDGNAEDLYKKVVEEKEEILIARNGRKDKNIMPVGNDVPFTIPKNWKWLRLGDIGFFKKGPFGSALTKSMFVPKGRDTVKVYEQQHAIKKNKKLGTYYIKRDYFESKMRGFEVRPGDIIISCAGTIGESYIMPDDIEQGIINQALMRVTLVPSVNKRFFQYYFDSNLKQLAQANGNGSAIINIPPFEMLKNWYFPLPPASEQIRIVDKISDILDEI